MAYLTPSNGTAAAWLAAALLAAAVLAGVVLYVRARLRARRQI